jgi:hypothetical protein
MLAALTCQPKEGTIMPESSIKYDRNERNGDPTGQRRPLRHSGDMKAGHPMQNRPFSPTRPGEAVDEQAGEGQGMTAEKKKERS